MSEAITTFLDALSTSVIICPGVWPPIGVTRMPGKSSLVLVDKPQSIVAPEFHNVVYLLGIDSPREQAPTGVRAGPEVQFGPRHAERRVGNLVTLPM